jgi:hypothetical protein
MLYFTPETKRGNGIGVFNAYEKTKSDPEVHALVRYLVNWVAGTKLIFIALLIVILITGDDTTKLFSVIALILSILSYFWRLNHIIRRMDNDGQISPKGYSKTLAIIITSFITIFALALAVYFAL